MKTVLRILSLSICALFFSSCIQHSTVLRIRKDGSGEIFVRNYFSPQMTGMIGGFSGDPSVKVGDPTSPDGDALKKDAEKFGEGVRYVRHEENKNKQGWKGYLAVYQFDDISKIKIDGESAMPSDLTEMAEQQGQKIGGEDTGEITFAMDDGVLTINSTMGTSGVDSFKNDAAGGGNIPAGTKPSEMMAPMAGMFAGMRMGHFLRIDGGIAETNAKHVNGDFITMSDIDLGNTMTDPEFLAFIDKAAADPESVTEDMVNELVPQVEGITAEMQKKITVKFK